MLLLDLFLFACVLVDVQESYSLPILLALGKLAGPCRLHQKHKLCTWAVLINILATIVVLVANTSNLDTFQWQNFVRLCVFGIKKKLLLAKKSCFMEMYGLVILIDLQNFDSSPLQFIS